MSGRNKKLFGLRGLNCLKGIMGLSSWVGNEKNAYFRDIEN